MSNGLKMKTINFFKKKNRDDILDFSAAIQKIEYAISLYKKTSTNSM